MIKTAIQYIKESLIEPSDRIVEFTDSENVDRVFIIDDNGRGQEIKPRLEIANESLLINTLTGLVNYIKSNSERVNNNFYLHVVDEQNVVLKGLLNKDGDREKLAIAKAIVPHFEYEHFHDAEELIIALQSTFTKTEDRDLLLKVVGNVKEENVRNTGDTGFSQAVTIQTGVASADDVKVPNPVTLAPYRTFLEVEQPSSEFIFRMKDGPRGAIFEADGGAWRNQAIANVRDYLKEALKEEIESGRITVIA